MIYILLFLLEYIPNNKSYGHFLETSHRAKKGELMINFYVIGIKKLTTPCFIISN